MKKVTLKSILLLLVLGICSAGFSQQRKNNNENNSKKTELQLVAESQQHYNETGIVKCYSIENEKKLKAKFPSRATEAEFEQWLAPKIVAFKKRQATEKMAVTTIPVIFHVFTNCEGTDNVSAGLIQAQLNQLNLDYADLSGSPFGFSADTEVRFSFAQVDPMGNILPESGINRIIDYGKGPFSQTEIQGTMKAVTQWDPTQYMNIWVADISGGLLGWAQFPDSTGLDGLSPSYGAANTDGVVIRSQSVGAVANPNPDGGQYASGRTLTHEVGHWLGLKHLWGDGDCTQDDYCTDTPNCTGQFFAGAGQPTGCTGSFQCGSTRQIENYMDYSDDTCMNTFTADQKARIQTVLGASPRRGVLGTSTVDNVVGPVVYIEMCTGTLVNEGSGCDYLDMVLQVGKSKVSTAAETITISTSGTATENIDYQVMTSSLSFAAGETTKQDFIIRVFEDGIVEADETIVLDLNITTSGNTNTTDNSNQITIVISNDDLATIPSIATIFSENFDPLTNNLSTENQDGDGNSWTISNEATFSTSVGFSGNFALSRSWNNSALTPNNFLITQSAIYIPSGLTDIELSFDAGTLESAPFDAEQYSVYLTTSNDATVIQGTTALYNEVLSFPTGGFNTRTVAVDPSFAGQVVYLTFRHHDCTDMNTMIIDNILITGTTNVQTALNSGTPNQASLPSSGTIYAIDDASANIMGAITNNNDVNYGCVNTSVSRASGTSQIYQTAGVTNYAMGKTFTISPTSVQAGGDATLKFYFTEEEIAAWETETGNIRTDLMVIKDNGSSEEAVPIIGVFGSGVTLEASFTSGISGTYYFAKMNVLGLTANTFEVFNVYPNPTNGMIEVLLSTIDDVHVSLVDIRGRRVYSEEFTHNSELFIQLFNFRNLDSGVYLISIVSGTKKAIKKIVIQ